MYRKEYYENNKEKYKKWNEKYLKENTDKIKKYQKKYFQENKDKIYVKQKEWRQQNKDKWIGAITESRKRRIERLREEGVLNPWSVVTKGLKPKYRKDV